MRFYEFKQGMQSQIELIEARQGLEAQHAVHDLSAISKSMSQIPPEKGEAKMELVAKLEKMAISVRAFVDKILAKPSQPIDPNAPTDPNVPIDPNAKVEAKANRNVQNKLYTIKDYEKADAKLEAALNKIKAAVEELNADASFSDAKKEEYTKMITAPLDTLVKQFEVVRNQRNSARAERDEAINFVKDVTGILVTLGNKVQGYTEEDPKKMNAAQKKKALNADKFTKTLKQALFGKILDMQEGGEVTGDEIKQFLQACVNGDVINMKSVMSRDSGNIKDHVNAGPNNMYNKVFDVFVAENIFSYLPGSTSGAIGPGEMALSMMGNPAEKGKTGDLLIDGQEIEIKASAKTGGRFNSKSISKATDGWKIWADGILKIMKNAPKDATISVTQEDNSEKLIPARKYNGNRHNVIKGKAKEGSKYNWNTGGFKALNIEVLRPYAKVEDTYNLFRNTIDGSDKVKRGLVLNYDKLSKPAKNNTHHVPFNPDQLIRQCINDDGTIHVGKINIAYSKIAYTSYHLADGITTVLLLNTKTLDYTIFKNADDLVKKMKSGNVVTGLNGGSGGFNWNDDQQTPTPGYMANI